jgi:hypothetical protein
MVAEVAVMAVADTAEIAGAAAAVVANVKFPDVAEVPPLLADVAA